MSREVVTDPFAAVPRPRPADAADPAPALPAGSAAPGREHGPAAGCPLAPDLGLGPVADPTLDLTLDPGSGPGAPAAAGPTAGRGRLTAILMVAVALVALLCGAAAGSTHATADARDRLVAGTRVMVWADGALVPGGGDAETAARPPLPVTLMVAGSPVTVLRLLLGTGTADLPAAMPLRPGARRAATVRLRPDCAALAKDGADPAAFGSARAEVRLPGTDRVRAVPLDVLGDPSAVVLALLTPCAAGSLAG